ncbi:hypothetical protein BKA62DRAFT_708508 [Auriculariales sp. MPI-PUGE-AT-0066]|nr:hypothetical protein BKA62DRAFT_708508 [Auriculariales sp. MPI-PUGE-AT-0066]
MQRWHWQFTKSDGVLRHLACPLTDGATIICIRALKCLLTCIMCKHILNAQVSIRAPCCKQWFDCPECHAEREDHKLSRTTEMIFACKQCKKTFRKDMTAYEESDEFCPHCDNHYVIAAKTPQTAPDLHGAAMLDSRMDNRLLKDDRAKETRTLEDDLDELLNS